MSDFAAMKIADLKKELKAKVGTPTYCMLHNYVRLYCRYRTPDQINKVIDQSLI